jgi:hypothetical protein
MMAIVMEGHFARRARTLQQWSRDPAWGKQPDKDDDKCKYVGIINKDLLIHTQRCL